MHRESIGFIFFRLLGILGILFFLGMLYWSSVLIEERMRSVEENILLIKGDLSNIKNSLSLIHLDPTKIKEEKKSSQDNLYHSERNLLHPDPFYTITLPKLLGTHFVPHGVRSEATIGKPATLHPFTNWSQVSGWISLCTLPLVSQQVGKYETYTPSMATAMELRESEDGHPEYWLFLRQDVFWEPLQLDHFPDGFSLAPMYFQRHQVTAHDYKFFLDAVLNPYVEEEQAVALRNFYSDVESVKVIDDFTLVVRWKMHTIRTQDGKEVKRMKYLAKGYTGSIRPLARFVYQHFSDGSKIIEDDADPDAYLKNPIWAQNFSQHWAKNVIVSCGGWLFNGITDREIRFRRNPNFFDPLAVLFQTYEVKFRESPDAIWQDFKINGVDAFEVPPNLLAELDRFLESYPYQQQVKQGLKINQLHYLNRSYNYIGWNQSNVLFKSKRVRQALTMSIDRERIIRQNLNGMGMQTTGTFFPLSPSYDTTIKYYPFDPEEALRILHEEGWADHDGDHILDKWIDGKWVPFHFTLTYFVKNSTTKSICDYVSTALKEIGIRCDLNGVDMADLSAVFEDKSFDAVFLGWALSNPPEDPRQLWYSTGAKEKGSSNAIGFANPEIDEIIDQLSYEFDEKKRIELYHKFDALLYEEAPYTFLYVPKVTLAYREYLQNVFIPAERQDLIPGADVGEPVPSIYFFRNVE